MKKLPEMKNYCDVNLSTKEDRTHHLKRIYCEEVDGNQYTLTLVPKHSDPDITGVCQIYNVTCKMEENQLTMKPIVFQEIENNNVRVVASDLRSFINALLHCKSIASGDDKKIFTMCERVRKQNVSGESREESEEYTEDEQQPFIPKWTSKNM